ncbi:MAG: hypothetical protein IJR00_06925 [Lachnospiraceae bacterium]|nr:hypothetical protein [Lachnospiraceae bacterium]
MKSFKRGMSLFFSALFLFVSVFSTVKMDVRAAGSWNTTPNTNGYQYVNSSGDVSGVQPVDGVYQGTDNTTFALDAPIATIYIDEKKVDRVAAAQEDMVKINETTWENSGEDKILKIEELWRTNNKLDNNLKDYLMIGNEHSSTYGFGSFGHNYMMFDQALAKSQGNGLNKATDNHIKGDLVRYTFKGAAEYAGKPADVVITYSDLHIVLQSNMDNGKYEELDKLLI